MRRYVALFVMLRMKNMKTIVCGKILRSSSRQRRCAAITGLGLFANEARRAA